MAWLWWHAVQFLWFNWNVTFTELLLLFTLRWKQFGLVNGWCIPLSGVLYTYVYGISRPRCDYIFTSCLILLLPFIAHVKLHKHKFQLFLLHFSVMGTKLGFYIINLLNAELGCMKYKYQMHLRSIFQLWYISYNTRKHKLDIVKHKK